MALDAGLDSLILGLCIMARIGAALAQASYTDEGFINDLFDSKYMGVKYGSRR